MSSRVSVQALHRGWSMIAAAPALPRILPFLLLFGGGGGWESRSNSAEEAAKRAERLFASLLLSPAFWLEPATGDVAVLDIGAGFWRGGARKES